MTWKRSSRCDYGGSCVEVARTNDTAYVRDGKIGEASPVLAFSRDAWRDFTVALSAGDFDA